MNHRTQRELAKRFAIEDYREDLTSESGSRATGVHVNGADGRGQTGADPATGASVLDSEERAEMNRVEVNSIFVNVFTMSVCAVDDATDEEILEVCNRDNPAGTQHGWAVVVRHEKNLAPVECADHKGRTHFLVTC